MKVKPAVDVECEVSLKKDRENIRGSVGSGKTQPLGPAPHPGVVKTPCVMKFGQGTSLFKAPRLPRRTLIYR